MINRLGAPLMAIGMKFNSYSPLLLTVLFCALIAHDPPAASATKPVAVVGGGLYGKFDSDRFVHRIMADSEIAWEDRGNSLDPSEFSRYSLVLWFSGATEEWSQRQVADFNAYLENGGRFLHTEGGIYLGALGRNLKPFPWLGAKSWNYHSKERIEGRFLQPQHPYLSGVDTSGKYNWLSAWYSLSPDEKTVSLIGTDTNSLLTVTPVGRGEIIWFWNGLFRVREDRASAPAMERIFKNILAAAQPLAVAEQIRTSVAAFSARPEALVAWKRDWQNGSQEDYFFLPAYPRPDEHLAVVSFYSAMDERDTQFFLCQSLASQQVKVVLPPLRQAGTGKEYTGHLKLLISERPPKVPSLARKGQEGLPDKLGRFMLTPVEGAFAVNDWRPRVLWLELSTLGLPAGDYETRLSLSGSKGHELRIPIQTRVYPVRMPQKRLVELRYWGGGVPSREPFLRELKRQGCSQITISYPDLSQIRLTETGQSLQQALKTDPQLFAAAEFPALDFSGVYDSAILAGLDNGLHYVLIHDVRTGFWVAQAGTGLKVEWEASAQDWPEEFRRIYTAYYRKLYRYLTERGFSEADLLWMDEPDMESIEKTYIPRARLHAAAGVGSGATWTAGGFMTPEQLRTFSPYTTSWSMYTITLPNFLKFWKDSSVPFHPRARAGITRGGTGMELRSSYNAARNLGWTIVYYGEPVSFLCTGPLWKEWLYYVDFDADGQRPQGVEGERLLAYGSSDPADGQTPLLSSSDWEGARDGIDDANLVRILEWYLNELRPRAASNKALAETLRAVEADRDTWFKGGSQACFRIEPKQYRVKATAYDYDAVEPPSSSALELLKKRVLDHLQRLAAFAGNAAPSLLWHDKPLIQRGDVKATLHLPAMPDDSMKQAVTDFRNKCRMLAGKELPVLNCDAWNKDPSRTAIVVGTASEKTVQDILTAKGWKVDCRYPGPGGYVIKSDPKDNLILITGPDRIGVARGLRNFSVFLDGRGHWLQAEWTRPPLLPPGQLQALVMGRMLTVQGHEPQRDSVRTQLRIDPAAGLRLVEHIGRGGKVHQVQIVARAGRPAVAVTEEVGIHLLARQEHVKQGVAVHQAVVLGRRASRLRVVMGHDQRRLVGMRVEGLGQPLELGLAQPAPNYARRVHRIQQEPIRMGRLDQDHVLVRRQRLATGLALRKGLPEHLAAVVVAHQQIRRQTGLAQRLRQLPQHGIVARQSIVEGTVAGDEHRRRTRAQRQDLVAHAHKVLHQVDSTRFAVAVGRDVDVRQEREAVGVGGELFGSQTRSSQQSGSGGQGAGQEASTRKTYSSGRHSVLAKAVGG